MFKIKYVIISVMMQLFLFSLFFMLISIVGVKYGGLENSKYILAMEMASYISVLVAGFFGARIAWDKGGIYALIMSSVWIVIRLLINFFMGNEIRIDSFIIKAIIILSLGLLSGALGVSKKNQKFI